MEHEKCATTAYPIVTQNYVTDKSVTREKYI
jgi:hypothetical protein